jgi:hypothetical protein
MLKVYIAGGDESVNARQIAVLDRAPRGFYVFGGCPGQADDAGILYYSRYLAYSLSVTFGAGRKARLDYVYSKFLKLPGQLEFFLLIHRGAG